MKDNNDINQSSCHTVDDNNNKIIMSTTTKKEMKTKKSVSFLKTVKVRTIMYNKPTYKERIWYSKQDFKTFQEDISETISLVQEFGYELENEQIDDFYICTIGLESRINQTAQETLRIRSIVTCAQSIIREQGIPDTLPTNDPVEVISHVYQHYNEDFQQMAHIRALSLHQDVMNTTTTQDDKEDDQESYNENDGDNYNSHVEDVDNLDDNDNANANEAIEKTTLSLAQNNSLPISSLATKTTWNQRRNASAA